MERTLLRAVKVMMTARRTGRFLCAPALAAVLLCSACAIYTLNPRGESEISTIAVEPLENETAEFGLADRLTEIIIDALIADGNLKVVSPAEADAILVGSLTYYDRVAEAFDQNDQVQSYKVRMDFNLTLRNSRSGEDFWTLKTRQEGIYTADEGTEEDGQRDAGTRLVEVIIDKTTKSW
ncbi:MAG TPA: LptE family protein [Acidobacteriota bacterium]|nr:LptE family protein [Acidobacteriota bacterium]